MRDKSIKILRRAIEKTEESLNTMGILIANKVIGDELYIHQFNNQKQKVVVECTIINITDRDFAVTLKDGRNLFLPKKYIGKTVFLTKEEAEQALKERENNA